MTTERWALVPVEPTPKMLSPIVGKTYANQDPLPVGKAMQREQLARSTKAGNYGFQDWMIPPVTEYEVAAGKYIAMLDVSPGATLLAEVLAARDAYNADEDIESLFALLAALDKLGPAAEGAA